MEQIGKIFVALGIFIACIGAIFWLGSRWFRLGKLPGDIIMEKPGFIFIFPITSMILLSILLSILLTVLWNVLMRR
ncbi:MAG: DUF2905 domain-containing protein [bacterium JZ-2024 1]